MNGRTLLLKVVPAVLVLALGANWVWGQRSERMDQVASLDEEIATLEAQLGPAENADRQRDVFRRSIERVSAAIPPDAALPELIRSLGALAASADVRWLKATFAEPAGSGAPVTAAPAPGGAKPPGSAGYGEINMSVEVAGTDANLRTYFDALTRLPRIFVVDSVDIVWDTKVTPAVGTAAMSVRAFTMPPLSPTGQPKAPAAAPASPVTTTAAG
jgi:Tfp pilus assembly protein PilO